MKTLLAVLLLLCLAAPASATNGLVAGFSTTTPTAAVGDTVRIRVEMSNPNLVALNGYACTVRWDHTKATFAGYEIANTNIKGPFGNLFLQSPCNGSVPGFNRHSIVAAGSPYGPFPGGELATLKFVVTAPGTITFDPSSDAYFSGEGCSINHPNALISFTNAGLFVIPDYDYGVSVTVSQPGGGCSPNPCELEKAGHLGVRVRAPREHWTAVAPSPWSKVKGLYK